MKVHRLRRYALGLVGVVLIPPFLWLGVVAVAPTDWAKRQITALLQGRTGRSIRLERMSVGLFGGIRLTQLEIGSPQHAGDPWLKTADLRVELGLWELLRGRLAPQSMEFDGTTLRVLRRTDGTFELAEFTAPEPITSIRSGSQPGHDNVAVHIRGATLIVIDEPSQTRLHMQNVEGEANHRDGKTVIESLRGTLNGGPFHLIGELDRSSGVPSVAGRLQVDDVVLDDGMSALRYAVPVLAGAPLNLKGHLDSEVYIQGIGSNWGDLSRSLVGHGVIAINPVDLDGAPLVAEISKIAELNRHGRVASIRSDFEIKDRRITTDHFTLNIGRVPMTLTGWTDFDGHLDYRINLKSLNDRLPDKARRLLGELNVELGKLSSLTLRGDVNRMVVRLNGVSLDKNMLRETGFTRDDREKLRAVGRQFLDQLVR